MTYGSLNYEPIQYVPSFLEKQRKFWAGKVCWQMKRKKTGIINDPLGQTHNYASSEHYFLLFCFSRFEKWGGRTDVRTDRRTDNMCENNYLYRQWLWVGRVDQKKAMLKTLTSPSIHEVLLMPWCGNTLVLGSESKKSKNLHQTQYITVR